jgi:chromosome partitioning protein
MDVITFASRKGGSGKSTLAAHLAVAAARPGRRTLLIDADSQGSLTLWYERRQQADLELWTCARDAGDAVLAARQHGYDLVIIDTQPNVSTLATQAIAAATLTIIPTRPSLFDLAAVKDTIAIAREARKPYAVVFNGAPALRGAAEVAAVADARQHLDNLKVPVWGGQITHRAAYSLALASGENAKEFAPGSAAADEVARLWSAIQRSLKAINMAKGGGLHKAAA